MDKKVNEALLLSPEFMEAFRTYLSQVKHLDHNNAQQVANDALTCIKDIPYFGIDENIFDVLGDNGDTVESVRKAQSSLRFLSEFLLDMLFIANRIKVDDNTVNTPSRLSKMFMGACIDSYKEPLSGRWSLPPTATMFPCHDGQDCKLSVNGGETYESLESKMYDADHMQLVMVETNLYGMCSHHLMPFGNLSPDRRGMVKIVYAPIKYIPGLSKIGRYVEFISRRGWVQEKLARVLANELMSKFSLAGVYVYMDRVIHSCSVHRGYADDTMMTNEYYTGVFKHHKSLLDRAKYMVFTSTSSTSGMSD